MSSGMRWAETTPTSQAMPNSARAATAGSMVGQSESEPMTTPTSGPSPVAVSWMSRSVVMGGPFGWDEAGARTPLSPGWAVG